MVNKSEMSEQQLEELLRSLPKIQDHRDPQDIYQNVSAKLRRRKNKTWVLPSVATAAALLLFVFIAPNIMDWQHSSEEPMEKSSTSESEDNKVKNREQQTDQTGENRHTEEKSSEDQNGPKALEAEELYTAVYDSEGSGKNVMTYYIPDQNAQNMVPVSVVVPAEKNKNRFQQYVDLMPKLQEEKWGLSEYYPLKAEFTFDESSGVLNVDLPSENMYEDGSASELSLTEVLTKNAAALGIKKITLSTDGNPGVNFGNQGPLTELPIEEARNHAYFFYYPTDKAKKPYLVPSTDPLENIKEAIEVMKNDIETYGLKASIPKEMKIDAVTASGRLLVIRLHDVTELSDDVKIIPSIEAILLTAKDFDYETVKIETEDPIQFGKFTFNEEWKVPSAPNEVSLP